MKRNLRSPLIPLVLLTGLACATSRIDSVNRDIPDWQVARPPVLIVHDFAISPAEAIEDVYGSGYANSTRASSKDETKAKKIAASLSKQLVDKLNKRGINARWAKDSGAPPENALVIKGHFVTIDEGSRAARMIIGFGVGATELRMQVQVYQATELGLRRILRAEVSGKGQKMPGMAVPVGVGAATGNVARSVVISGGMNIIQEVTGSIDADVGRLAEQVAKRAEAFYKRQRWL